MKGYSFKKLSFTVIAALILVSSFPLVPKVSAAAGEGTATIAVDGGAQGAGVTVVQSTSHVFTVILAVGTPGMTLGASSPTFTIPTDFTAPHANGGAAVPANAGQVDVDGEWFAVAAGCTVAMGSSGASGQVITVDVTADCAAGNTITLTYKGTSSVAMGATALEVRTADGAPAAALIAASPTITVTAAPTPTPTSTPTSTPTPTPTPTTTPTSSPTSDSGGSNSGGSSSTVGTATCPTFSYITPNIIESKRVDSDSIFISWGPYSGINTFNIRYGLINGNWPYNTNVTGFSTTLNNLPSNQSIWVQVAATNGCSIGNYGAAVLAGGPSLPNTGFAPNKNYIPWNIIPAGIVLLSLFLLKLKRT